MGLLGKAILIVVLGIVAACGGGDGDRVVSDNADDGLQPPGTELFNGLVVPDGARLVGGTFPVPLPDDPLYPTAQRVALLRLDNDPFAVWDDLADQASNIGLVLPGSGICEWFGAGPGDAPDSMTVANAPRPSGADVVRCDGAATGYAVDGTSLRMMASLWWGPEGAELYLNVQELAIDEGEFSFPEDDLGSAPDGARADLPPLGDTDLPQVGEPFGREHNCFESGYDVFTVPSGSVVIGPGAVNVPRDFTAVLRVDNAKEVLEALIDQLDSEESEDGIYRLEELPLPDGGTTLIASGSVSAGGGGCEMWASPDGTMVMVMTSSD